MREIFEVGSVEFDAAAAVLVAALAADAVCDSSPLVFKQKIVLVSRLFLASPAECLPSAPASSPTSMWYSKHRRRRRKTLPKSSSPAAFSVWLTTQRRENTGTSARTWYENISHFFAHKLNQVTSISNETQKLFSGSKPIAFYCHGLK